MRYVVAEHERGDEMMDGTGLPAVRTQDESVHAAHPTKLVQRPQVGVHVIHVVGVRRVVILRRPVLGGKEEAATD